MNEIQLPKLKEKKLEKRWQKEKMARKTSVNSVAKIKKNADRKLHEVKIEKLRKRSFDSLLCFELFPAVIKVFFQDWITQLIKVFNTILSVN